MVDPEDMGAAAACCMCNRAFSFAVLHCPFCGKQQPASSQPVATPVAVMPAVPPPAAAPVHGTDASPTVPVWDLPDQAVAPVAAASGKRRPLPWLRILVGLCACIAAAWLLLPYPGAHLTVEAASGAQGRVLIDGSDAGWTGDTLEIAAGAHDVGLQIDGHTATLGVVLASGDSRVVTFSNSPPPREAKATLVFLRETPDVTVVIDGRTVGSGDEATVEPGSHQLTASSPDHADLALNLLLQPGERRVVPLTLLPTTQPTLAAPPATDAAPEAAPVSALPVVSAGIWTTFGDPAGPGRSCGVQAAISGGTLMLFGRGDAPATLRLALHKEAWHIPDLAVPIEIAFSGGSDPKSSTFRFRASGSGSDIRADIPDEDVRAFIHHFTADQTATLTLPEGHELPWPIDLHGTTPTITGMAKCLEAAQIWLPLPFTQRPAADTPAPPPADAPAPASAPG